MVSQSSPESFWNRVAVSENPDACWTWSGYRAAGGYGKVWWNSTHALAHRVAYELTHGSISDGLFALHSCDNPPCCNPAHLWLGTHLDNARDRESKGRGVRLTRADHGRARLSEQDVAEIRSCRESNVVLAATYGVHRSTIRRARLGITWTEASANG